MLRKCLSVSVLGFAVLLVAADLAQAQGLRERRMERRDARRGIVYDSNLNGGGYYYSDGTLVPASGMQQAGMQLGMQPTVQTTVTPNARISFYPAQNLNDCAQIRVIVPSPEAKVYFDGKATSSTGMDRTFDTPTLPQGTSSYMVRCTWMENGQLVERGLSVPCSPNSICTVDFTAPGGRVMVR